MKRFLLLIISFLICIICASTTASASSRHVKRDVRNEFKMCVPDDLMAACEEMARQTTKSSATIICIPARDRLQCLAKIKSREADFGVVDPEDMYNAGKLTSDDDFAVFEEIRTLEEPEAEFRYEGVAVVHKDLPINGIQDLKGLKSCHTGIGRNVGYKIPITKLKQLGLIGHLADQSLSARENELEALSTLFAKACIVGKWSPDANIDKKLKLRYPNLCDLCEDPGKCDYPDKYSGYDGALRCLAYNGGQIAWTKVIYVRKFFGLPVGTTPGHATNEQPGDYAYLCPDGSKLPIDGPACSWAARPWPGYMANVAIVKNIAELRTKIENLNSEGVKTHAAWLGKVLEIDESKNVARESKIINPKQYLDKAKYTDVVERDYGPPYRTVRICARSQDELAKCKEFATGAFSRDIRPRFDCVLADDCMATLRDNGADIISLAPDDVLKAVDRYNLKPIIGEYYDDDNYAIAVVKKQSGMQSFDDLKNAKSCHVGYQMAGYHAPLNALKRAGKLVKQQPCSGADALAAYFSAGCLPHADQYNITAETRSRMCRLCSDDGDACTMGHNTNLDAIECLDEQGDVAFIESVFVAQMTESAKANYELLCPDGSKASLDDYKRCHLLHTAMPPNMIVTSSAKSVMEIEEIQNALLSASALYTKRPDLFKMFGRYNGTPNLLFSDAVKSLKTIDADFAPNEARKILSVDAEFCTTSQ